MTCQQMEDRIKDRYPNCEVAVIDMTGSQNHFEVRISEPSFAGQSRIQQHKAIMDVFDIELKSGEVHALSIKTLKF